MEKARAAEDAANDARDELEAFNQRLNSSTVLLSSGRAHADAQRWADAYELYTEATTMLPSYSLVWLERGRLNAKLGRWESAANDFAKAVRIGCPVEQTELSGVPQLLYYGGETSAYEKLCEQFSRSQQDDPASVATRGRLVGEISPSTAAELALRVERMLTDSDGGEKSVSKSTHAFDKRRTHYREMYRGANLYVAGWAHLKAGDNEKAMKRLEQSSNANWLGRGIESPLIAIAHHRMGRADEALRWFEQSETLLDRLLDESVGQSRGTPVIPWIDWIEFLLNHREASIIVKGHTPVTDPRIRQMNDFAEASIAD
ncbi:tetratricopeptide repeat protein [Novipirellula artificiosorum]|uniref:tetratricopeptide repeat protein n=1 Tax=Novipirellula artificiosorum TaxID=2528016 RepID=UPI0011B796FD|nr:tetratricopeptide repeat protein [Novipirellula artificiosorum]